MSTFPPYHILRLQAMHQKFHQYTPCHKFVRGTDNSISDQPSCSREITDDAFLSYMDSTYPQEMPWRLWDLPIALINAIDSAIR